MRGSVIVAYEEGFQTFGDPLYRIKINSAETRDFQFGEANSLYSTYMFSGDTVTLRIINLGYGEVPSATILLTEYTNDNEGDGGRKITLITGATGNNTGTIFEFGPITINPSASAYDFIVVVAMNITQGVAPIGVFSGSTQTPIPRAIEIKNKNVGTVPVNMGDIYVGLLSVPDKAYTYLSSTNAVGSVVRLNANYGLDTDFNTISSLGSYYVVNDIEVQNDGKVLIGGSELTPPISGLTTGYSLNRLTTSGALDSTFTRYLFTGTAVESVTDVSQQSNGKIIASGNFTQISGLTYNSYARFNYNGTIDNTFYSGGTGTGFSNAMNNVVDNQDRVYFFAGLNSTFNGTTFGGLLRLTANGQLDTTFNGTGRGLFGNSPGGGGVNNVTILSDGKLLCSGLFNRYAGVPCPSGLVRLNQDGSLDTTFNSGGAGLSAPFAVFSINTCETIIDKEDVYLVLYQSTPTTGITYNGVTIPSQIFMVNNDGSLNMQFNANAGTGLSGGVPISLKRLSNDSVLISGDINSYNGTVIPDGKMIQISATGILQS